MESHVLATLMYIRKYGNTSDRRDAKKTYNYYPRGRVETKNNGSAVVYMNPNIGEGYIKDIMEIYRLSEYPCIKYDYSRHYKCYLDVGWKAKRRC